jgi:glutamate dehydrogenase/leucine dehydrogenase
MTYKMVLAGLPMGGAKSVIIGDPATDKTPGLLRAFGRFVESLNGRYTCGPDIGTDEVDMEAIAQETDYVAGRSSRSGSTAPPTAVGVFNGLRATAEVALGRLGLDGVRVAVQGAGGVGSELTRLLVDAGAVVTVADVDHDAIRTLTARFPVISVVPPDMVLSADVDIVSPNAIGAVLNQDTIPTIMAKAICGSANNQLATPADADTLVDHGILWAPDFVVSSGGAIAGSCEVGAITEDQRDTGLDRIHRTTIEILAKAKAQNVSTDGVAQGMARALLAEEV